MNAEKLLWGFIGISLVALLLLLFRPPFTPEKLFLGGGSLVVMAALGFKLWRVRRSHRDGADEGGPE